MRVAIGFDLGLNGSEANVATLDSPTLGVLDDPATVLGGAGLFDVTDYLRQVTIRRGRSQALDRNTTGNANLVLDNRTRLFDPTFAAGPYYGSIKPGKQITVEVDGVRCFTGNIADWNYGYDVSGDSLALPSAVDGFAYLAQRQVTAGTQTSELAGTRVEKVLDDVGWSPEQRTIAAGQSLLDADVIQPGTSALAYLQKIETSEFGNLFIDRNGFAEFQDRYSPSQGTAVVTFGTAGIPFTSIAVDYGIESMVNSVEVVYPDGTAVGGTATAASTASIDAYGLFPTTYDTLLNDQTEAEALADYVVGFYAEPKYRISEIEVVVNALTPAQVTQLLGVDLGDVALVEWTPNNTGAPIAQYAVIEGISHTADPNVHRVRLQLAQGVGSFTLDSAAFGVLDDDLLGY